MEQEAVSSDLTQMGRSARKEALVVCRRCGHLVPRTMTCLYCGAPILLRRTRRAR